MIKKVFILTALLLLGASSAFAIQEHGGVEAYYVHQIAHIFFIVAMVLLMRVLKGPISAKGTGWRNIRISAIFFILWNADAFIGHTAGTYLEPKSDYIVGSEIILKDVYARLYYMTTLTENVFLGLAFIFLAVGLRGIYARLKQEEAL